MLRESLVLVHVIAQIATTLHLHDEVQVVHVLKGLHHIHNERVLQLSQNFSFIDHRADAPFRKHTRLVHFFHCEYFVVLLPLDEPDLAEAALANLAHELKVVTLHLAELVTAIRVVLLVLTLAITH